MRRIISILVAILLASVCADAQKNIMHEEEFDGFTSVEVYDNFILTLVASDRFMLRTTVDERIDDYVKAYVQNGVLYITLDRKKFSSELKKVLRARGAAAPVLEAEVYFPAINSLKINDNVIVHRADPIYTDAFALIAGDKTRVDKLTVNCEYMELNINKNSYVDLVANASKQLSVISSGSSEAVVKQTGGELKVNASGYSSVNAITETESVDILSSGSSDVVFVSGKSSSLTVNSSGASKVNAEAVAIAKAEMMQSGTSRCYVNVSDTLKVNLTGSTMLSFMQEPYIKVERIVGSTLIKHDDPRRK